MIKVVFVFIAFGLISSLSHAECLWNQREMASFENRVALIQSAYSQGELSLKRCNAHMKTAAFHLGVLTTGCSISEFKEIQQASANLICEK